MPEQGQTERHSSINDCNVPTWLSIADIPFSILAHSSLLIVFIPLLLPHDNTFLVLSDHNTAEMSVMYDAPAPWRICPSNVNGNSLNSSRPDSQHDDLPPIALGSSLHPLQHHPLPHYPTLEPYNDLHYHNSNVRYQHVIARPDTEAELEARKVYSKLLAYDKYRKHRDAYKKPSNKPWPDDVEFAFLRGEPRYHRRSVSYHAHTSIAIVRWPPTWRQRYHPQDLILTAGVPLIVEDMGIPLAKLKAGLQRNEVVSVYILRMTGQLRKRKQVSSHLQTLKAFVGNDTYCRPRRCAIQHTELINRLQCMIISFPRIRKRRPRQSVPSHRKPRKGKSREARVSATTRALMILVLRTRCTM